MRAAKAGSKKEKSIEFMTQATESQVEEKGMAEEKQDVKETAVAPADDQGTKETAAEAKPAVNSETTSETAAAEKPVKKTTRRRTAAKAVPAKKKAAEVSKKDVAAEAETSKQNSAAEADQAVEKEVPVKKTADKTTTKAAPGKKAAAKTKAPARAKKETKEIIKEAVETVAAEPVKSESKNYVGIKDKMPTYLL